MNKALTYARAPFVHFLGVHVYISAFLAGVVNIAL